MATDELEFLDRETLLGGGMAPGRRASALLFAIESRTAAPGCQSQQATAWYLTRKAAAEREQEFLDALAEGRDLPVAPTIQQIERYAANWTPLVTDADPGLRAALARGMGQKYRLVEGAVPGIRAALGLDTAEVQEAYQRFYGEPLASIYTRKVVFGERLRWMTVGRWPPVGDAAAVLGRPGLNPAPQRWAAGASHCVGRHRRAARYRVADHLRASLTRSRLRPWPRAWRAAAPPALAWASSANSCPSTWATPARCLLTVIMAINNFLVLIVFYMGVAGTLEERAAVARRNCGLPRFLRVGLYFLSRKSLNTTVSAALMISAINVVLVVVIILLALPHVQPANLAYSQVPFVNGQPLTPPSGRWSSASC